MRVACVGALLVALTTIGCGSGATSEPHTAKNAAAQLNIVAVSDDQFADSVGRVLIDGEKTPARTGLLVGVVRRQLERAQARFENGHEDAGLAAVTGALLLVRAGEYHPEMLKGAEGALAKFAEHAARTGNEGQTLAAYSMLRAVLPPGKERDDVDEHIRSLNGWRESTRGSNSLQAAADDQRVASDRSVVQPGEDTLKAANSATVDWILRAIDYSREQLAPSSSFERDEAIEAYRAVRTGALLLSAVYLRHGDAQGALDAVEQGEVARVVSPNLHDALRRAAEENDPDAYFELFRTFDTFVEEAPMDVPMDPELARAASWGAALELYRIEPNTMRGIMPLATWLMRNRMAEAAVPLLQPILGEEPIDARSLSWSIAFVLQGIVDEDAVGDVSAARRIYTRARPLLEAAAKQRAGQINPSVARVEYVMGAIEARAGELTAARTLLEASAQSEPTMQTLRLLAAIDRQRGAAMEALKSLERVSSLAVQSNDSASAAEAQLSIFEIQRDIGNKDGAQKALEVALRRALSAREAAHADAEEATAERTLARVLEYYGEQDLARKAMERAYEASRNDVHQLTATVLEASRRALTRGDLKAARDAARRALDADLDDEDLVYVALWLKLLEKDLKVPSDGTTEEAFSSIDEDSGWPAKLRAWSSGKLTDEQLYKAARSTVQRTEALFYTAMAKRAASKDPQALEQLKQVAQSEAIQLVEVTIARDLLSETQSPVHVNLPKDVTVP